MPAQVTTRAQVNGYRFLIRRLEHALIRADSRMIHDPMRGQIRSLLVGLVIAILITGAAGVLAFFKPSPNIGNAQILLSASNGGLYVRIGDRLHPVLNLASARLITGKPDAPKSVSDKWLNQLPRGPMVGIIGAPNSIHAGADMRTSVWTACDSVATPDVAKSVGVASVQTTVVAGDLTLDEDIRKATPAQMLLVRSGDAVYLIFDGVRAVIDPNDAVVVNALHLQNAATRAISGALLNAFPLVPPIRPVMIPGAGSAMPGLPAGYPVGSVVKTVDSRGEQLYVVLPDGLQPVSPAAADIIRYSNPAAPEAREVPPSVVSRVPIVHTLAIDHYPGVSPQIVNAEPDRVVCMQWERANSAAQATVRLLVGHRLPIPDGAQPVGLATGDGNGPGVDSVYVKPGTGEYIQATGGEPDSRALGQLFYVSDAGVRYHIKDLPTAAALGVTGVHDPKLDTDVPQLAPWPVVSLLPAGPDLSQEAALVAHDGMGADPRGSKVEPPRS
ncbi:MAG: type VII secretion protein EccB [Mycobacterium sp.]|uniref:Type VII secretion protein EccB n=1 Tax=Mycobacterium gordonae TaxID=1778 RepID=A0A1A6B9M9_MYCGO|nr:type VII secretion protein EccB [Mycobacterium gordonae]OBR99029.1 type VII secretion protein EccB [Mycobacterium gordonae]PJE16015.1 MAG: type VII secretion protein EccB [Mycobacterium sp.]